MKAHPIINLGQRIRYDIESNILTGKWPPGHRIPNEHRLMEQYKCARMTVNTALSMLAAAGYIERRRRAGTFVASSHVQSAVLEIHDVKSEIVGRGKEYRYELLLRRLRQATVEDQKRLDIPKKQYVLMLRGRHFASGRPFSVEDRIFNLAAVSGAHEADFSNTSPSSWLLERMPWIEAEHFITAVNADETTAELLNIEVGAACLMIERKTWRSRQAVTFARLMYPGTLYHLFAHFTPSARTATKRVGRSAKR